MAEVLKTNNMERRAKSGPFKMKSPLKNTGTILPEVKVTAKKTKKGTFVQDERGSSIAGSSIEHADLRGKSKTKSLTSKERSRPKQETAICK